jgi:regulatory protein
VADVFNQISSLAPSQRNPKRIVVKVGGRAVATVPESAVLSLGLRIGMPWDDKLAQDVADASAFGKALTKASNVLGHRPRSTKQLRDRMKRLGWDEPMIERVIERLTQTRALDDEAFGRALVHEMQARKPAGPALLRAKLRQRGLENRLIEKLIAEVREDTSRDAVADATELARKKLRSLTRFDPLTRKRRLWGMLARRGFDRDTIDEAMARVKELSEGEAGEF